MLMFTPKGYMSVSNFQGIGTWFIGRLGSVELTVGLSDHRGFFNLNDPVIL